MELPEGTPPTSVGARGVVVTLREPGPLGIRWSKHTASPRGTPRDFAVVKSVTKGSSAATAGIRPFEVLMSINGMTVAPMDFDTLIQTIRKTRPLHLTFAPLERAWLRADVLFASPGPLGLKLEPASGDSRAPGARLKKVLPTSVLANRDELTAGMDLVAMRIGLQQPIQLNRMPYSEVVQRLKGASRPLTLFFDPTEVQTQVATQSAASTTNTSSCTTNAVPSWSRTTEEAVRAALGQHGQDAQLAPKVCEAFSNTQYHPGTWVSELASMHRQNELASFMASVSHFTSATAARRSKDEGLLSTEVHNPVPAAKAVTDPTGPLVEPPVHEVETQAMVAVVAEENFKALTLLENYTEEVLSSMLHITETELERLRHEAAAKQSANAEALAIWQERAESAERAAAAVREVATLATSNTGQGTLTPCNRDESLRERCKTLELRVEHLESRLREKEESHQAELHVRDILLRATELELARACGRTQREDSQDSSHASDTNSMPSQHPGRPNREPKEAAHKMRNIGTGILNQARQGVNEEVPTWPSFFKRELERLSEEQRHREDHIRAEALAQVAKERAVIEAKHASYEDVVERAYAQVLNIFDMPKLDQSRAH